MKYLIASFLLLLLACPNGSPPIGTVKYWQGDSAWASITRAQDNARIFCIDKEFDRYSCVLTEDLVAYHELLISSCSSWATREQWKEFIKANNCKCGDKQWQAIKIQDN